MILKHEMTFSSNSPCTLIRNWKLLQAGVELGLNRRLRQLNCTAGISWVEKNKRQDKYSIKCWLKLATKSLVPDPESQVPNLAQSKKKFSTKKNFGPEKM